VRGVSGQDEANYDQLIDLIEQTLQPDSWQDTGAGQGSIMEFENKQVLVISNTDEVQRKVTDLLARLRSLGGASAIDAEAAKLDGSTPAGPKPAAGPLVTSVAPNGAFGGGPSSPRAAPGGRSSSRRGGSGFSAGGMGGMMGGMPANRSEVISGMGGMGGMPAGMGMGGMGGMGGMRTKKGAGAPGGGFAAGPAQTGGDPLLEGLQSTSQQYQGQQVEGLNKRYQKGKAMGGKGGIGMGGMM
jgi:hypothetical protein